MTTLRNMIGIGPHCDGLWGTPAELVAQAPIVPGALGGGGSPASAEMRADLGGGMQEPSVSDSSFYYDAAMFGDGGSSPVQGSKLFGQIYDCLRRNEVTRLTADTVLKGACDRNNIRPRDVSGKYLPNLIDAIESSVKYFVGESALANIMAELKALNHTAASLAAGNQPAKRHTVSIAIDNESAINEARNAALNFAQSADFESADSVKVATVVSELTRNILLYAESGTIELRLISNGIEVVAKDSGPGIPHIDEVMSGKWRSKTGLGIGIRGSARLVDEFDVQTKEGHGTTVTAIKYRR